MEINIKNLRKNYGKNIALKGISFTIQTGMFGLLGRNGAGKTTLMRILASLIEKSEGDVKICNIPISNRKEIRKIIGYLPQDFSMYPTMSIYEAMDYLGLLSGLSKKERKERIPFVLNKVNLGDFYKIKIKALSGGMKRRLGIAQAILHNPKVLIVDEPTAGLDIEERIRFRNLLCEISEDKIVILSTHIVEDIESTCESIAILDTGNLIYSGTSKELMQKAKGKVYESEVSKDKLEELKEKHIVTGILSSGNKVYIRLISDTKPDIDSNLSAPTIEDSYMLLVGGDI